jgi:uncharacterized peroxidase-related enzyme
MPRIRWITEDQATGEIADLYAYIRQRRSRITVLRALPQRAQHVGDILKCFSPHPGALRGAVQLTDSLHFADGALSAGVKEMLATYVSALNSCQYCAATHGYFLQLKGADRERALAIARRDLDAADLDDRTRALMEFAGKLTLEPFKITDGDVARLRDRGWSEAQIAETVLDVALFNMLNRVADAFGISRDEEELLPFSPPPPEEGKVESGVIT